MSDKNNFKATPSSSKGLPIIHNLRDLKYNTFNFFRKNCSSRGPLFFFRVFNRRFFVLNHPSYVKHVLVDNEKNYTRKRTYAIFDEILGVGLITSEGEVWKKRRRIAQPAFSKSKMDLLINDMDATITSFWTRHEKSGDNKIEVDAEMNYLALDLLCSSIIKTDLEDKSERIRENLNDAFTYVSNKRFRAIKALDLPTPLKIKGKKAIKEIKGTISGIIENRRKSEEDHHDLLSNLMGAVDQESNQSLTNEELIDEVMTLFIAGHDTTAVVMNWVFYLIAKRPEVQEKILAEIKEKGDAETLDMNAIMSFDYTRRVLQETMRLYPPVWSFGRKTIEADNIDGFEIPAHTSINLPAMFIHRSPEYWEKPEEFYPDHFLAEKVKERPKYAYFPFGGGKRKCIGEHFAIMEMMLVLVRSVSKYQFKLESEKDPGLVLSITIKPKDRIWIHTKKRN